MRKRKDLPRQKCSECGIVANHLLKDLCQDCYRNKYTKVSAESCNECGGFGKIPECSKCGDIASFRNPHSKLTPEQKEDIEYDLWEGFTQKEIARKRHLSQPYISILARKAGLGARRRGNWNFLIEPQTPEMLQQIELDLWEGVLTQTQIAEKYRQHQSAISKIAKSLDLSGRSWIKRNPQRKIQDNSDYWEAEEEIAYGREVEKAEKLGRICPVCNIMLDPSKDGTWWGCRYSFPKKWMLDETKYSWPITKEEIDRHEPGKKWTQKELNALMKRKPNRQNPFEDNYDEWRWVESFDEPIHYCRYQGAPFNTICGEHGGLITFHISGVTCQNCLDILSCYEVI